MGRRNSTNWSVNDQITAVRLQNFNQEFDDIYVYGDDRGRVRAALSGTALKIDIAAFNWRVGSTLGQYAGGTDITVTNTATNYVEIDSTGTIVINTSGFVTANARLGTVVCAGGVVTTVTIWKPDVVGGILGTSTLVTVLSMSTDITLITTSKYHQILDPNGADRIVTMDTSGMTEGTDFFIQNSATSNYLTIKQSSTILATVAPGNGVLMTYDGTNWKPIFKSNQKILVIAKTAAYTVTEGDTAKMINNSGTTNPVAVTLPTDNIGVHLEFCCLDTDGIAAIADVLDVVDDGATVGLAGFYSIALSSTMELTKVTATKWVVTKKNGTWVAYAPKGFVMGGNSGSPTAQVDTIKFSDDTKSTALNNLVAAREGGAGIQGPIGKAYYGGGYNSGGTSQTTVYKFFTIQEVFSTNSDSLTQKCSELLRGFSSSTKGYKAAGYNDGPNTAVVDGVTFSTDAIAAITSLAAARHGLGNHNSATAGYAVGGDASATAQYKLTFSGETWATLVGVLPIVRYGPGSCHSSTKGYYGGSNPAVNSIVALTNASDTSATLGATLSDTRMRMAGFQKSTDGYWCAGYKAAAVNIVNKINFGAETVSTPAATIGSATNSPSGCSNGAPF